MIIFTLAVGWINIYPVRYKESLMGGYGAGNLRANPFIYKFATQNDDQGSVVVLEVDGPIGCYNRSNRSLQHFLENSLPFLFSLPIAFYLFPFPSSVLVLIFCVGRIVH